MDPAVASPALAAGHLADAFTSFIAAADRLEHTHAQLHNEVANLRTQLEERNRALASSLAENESMRVALRQILDTLPCGVAVLEIEDEKVVLLNPEARKLLEIPGDQAPSWADLPLRIRTMLTAGRSQAWKQGDEQDFCFEENGKKRWVTVRYSMMGLADNGTIEAHNNHSTKVILTCRDTTTSKAAEQEREASRNVVALAEMSTVLAHEVRNPLGSMELLAGLLASDAGLSEDSKQGVQHLQAGVRSLSAIVNNVLRFYSMGTATLQPVRLAEALRSAVNFAQPLARQNGTALSLQQSLSDAEIAADASELQQVVLNLVCNALRHTPAGGRITVLGNLDARASTPVAVVEVVDTGAGIAPADLPHIFEAGFSTSKQSPGLGLTVCQRIVEQHHGTISVQSELGKGTTFRMEFPVR
jgi:two-component system sensor histidine kinase FlrB